MMVYFILPISWFFSRDPFRLTVYEIIPVQLGRPPNVKEKKHKQTHEHY